MFDGNCNNYNCDGNCNNYDCDGNCNYSYKLVI